LAKVDATLVEVRVTLVEVETPPPDPAPATTRANPDFHGPAAGKGDSGGIIGGGRPRASGRCATSLIVPCKSHCKMTRRDSMGTRVSIFSPEMPTPLLESGTLVNKLNDRLESAC
jgi:hypothetical protein